jgi:hypothetical protein
MNTTLSQNESREMLKWLNRNRRMLLDLYRNQYVAYNANRLIAHSENLRELLDLLPSRQKNTYFSADPKAIAKRCCEAQIAVFSSVK